MSQNYESEGHVVCGPQATILISEERRPLEVDRTWPRHAAAARSLNVAATGLIRFSASSMLTCLVLVTTSFKVALIAAAFC
jgi:hypothetical protein